jgi:starvation-inducible DNA-binding protein
MALPLRAIKFVFKSIVMKPNIGLSDHSTQEVANLLNALLADEFLLYAKTRNYHWNVEGPNFHDLHKLFEGQYEELDEIIDDTAERVRQIGHYALGSLDAFLKYAHLTEGQQASSAAEMIQSLLDDHETLIRELRNSIVIAGEQHKDAGTADFFTRILESHEKTAWMLRATGK